MLIHALCALALVTPLASGQTTGRLASRQPSATPTTSVGDPAPRRRTLFGVAIAPVPERIRRLPYLLENEGVVVTEVQAGGAAEAGALKAGDIILGIDGK